MTPAKAAASDPPNPKGTLFRTKEGDVDFGWVLLIIGFANGILLFDLDAFGVVKISTPAYAWYGSVITMCFIAGAAIARARLIAKADVSAAQARAIDAVVEVDPKAALAPKVEPVVVVTTEAPASTEPDLFKDDERG
jgi:hypothetical protein